MIKYVFADKPLTILNAETADAQKIGQALEDITVANGGRLTPQKVVEVAKKDRRLHPHFEWSDRSKSGGSKTSRIVACRDPASPHRSG